MTERERQDAADTALMSRLFENLESGEDDSEELGEYGMEEDDDEDEDDEDEVDDTDEEEESDEDEEDDMEEEADESLRARGMAWLGLTAQRSTGGFQVSQSCLQSSRSHCYILQLSC